MVKIVHKYSVTTSAYYRMLFSSFPFCFFNVLRIIRVVLTHPLHQALLLQQVFLYIPAFACRPCPSSACLLLEVYHLGVIRLSSVISVTPSLVSCSAGIPHLSICCVTPSLNVMFFKNDHFLWSCHLSRFWFLFEDLSAFCVFPCVAVLLATPTTLLPLGLHPVHYAY